jgi:hypothetical protein
MGPEAANPTRASTLAVRGSDEERSARLRAIGEVVRLYEGLEQALQTVSDDELARLATAARAGERALDRWARSIEVFRRFKRRIDAGLPPANETLEANAYERATEPEWLEDDEDGGPPPLVWEALAFAIGFIVSFLVT